MEIDALEQDVYETVDTDEDELSDPMSNISDDLGGDLGSDETGDIDRQTTSIGKASEKFVNGTLDARYADFSGRIRSSNSKRNIDSRRLLPDSNEYYSRGGSSCIDGQEESNIQKLRRLIFEVSELEEDVSQKQTPDAVSTIPPGTTTDSTTPSKASKVITYTQIVDQVSILQSELSKIAQSMGHNPNLPINNSIDGGGTMLKHIQVGKLLMSQLQAYKEKSVNLNVKESANIVADPLLSTSFDSASLRKDQVVYELFYTPESSKLISLSKAQNLESRVASLERLLGTHLFKNLESSEDSVATIIQSSGSLIGAVERLDHHLALLTQPRNLDGVVKRVRLVIADLERMAELRKKQQFEFRPSVVLGIESVNDGGNSKTDGTCSESDEKVDYLFSMLEKLDSVASVIPHLIGRLHALKSLHGEAAVFSDSLKDLAAEQARIGDSGRAIEDGVKQLLNTMKDNETKVLGNVASIEQRMTDLAKRLDKISLI